MIGYSGSGQPMELVSSNTMSIFQFASAAPVSPIVQANGTRYSIVPEESLG
jgi:hypothetical protein